MINCAETTVLEDAEFYRQRMLEEQLRAQTSTGEMRQFHLGWASLFEDRLRSMSREANRQVQHPTS